jgi:hypothetical protein
MKLDHTDYLVFTDELVQALRIVIKKTPGGTPDKVANGWHFDLSELTATQVHWLAKELVNRAEMVTVLKDELVTALQVASAAGEIDKSKVNKEVRAQVGIADPPN